MIQKIRAFTERHRELVDKAMYTLMMLAVYRIGTHIPAPFVDSAKVGEFFSASGGSKGVLSMVDMFTGGGFTKMSVMAIGIMPYISAQIILQLLMIVWPRLEKLKKEGEAGQKKIEQWTRYGTVLIALVQSIGISTFIASNGLISDSILGMTLFGIPSILGVDVGNILFVLMTMVSVTTGTVLLMWIGERITANGIGNGISLIIAIGIVARYPADALLMYQNISNDMLSVIWVPIIAALGIATIIAIILIQEGSRKVPIQHARRTVGRRVQAAQTNYLPLKVNTAGVIPVIFSSAILSFPQVLFSAISFGEGGDPMGSLGMWFSPQSPYNLYQALGMEKGSIFLLLKMVNLYTFLYVLLTGFFCFFYTAVTFNPTDVAENLKKAGAFIPGYRPGKQTADYIDMVLTRITTVGAVFLVVVALIPMVLTMAFDVNWMFAEFAGGTGLIIVVGVALDTMKRIEAQMLLRNYDAFGARRAAGRATGPTGARRWTGRRTA